MARTKVTKKEENDNNLELKGTKTKNANISVAERKNSKKIASTLKSKTTKATSTKKNSVKSTKKSTSRKTTPRKKTAPKKLALPNETEDFVDIPEYYDLPYKYEKTVVKVLYQNPTTLFVYWDVSDDDIDGFKKTYGDNFFYVTKPVLVIHNITDGYSFEIEVNDFANNWYIHVSDAKCKYNVELGRRPSQSAKIENLTEHRMDEFINVSYSNTVEIPNDHILFFKDNDKIYFKNIKTNKVTEKVINLKRDSKHIKPIYDKYNLTENEDRFDFNNPSSQNPTSNVM